MSRGLIGERGEAMEEEEELFEESRVGLEGEELGSIGRSPMIDLRSILETDAVLKRGGFEWEKDEGLTWNTSVLFRLNCLCLIVFLSSSAVFNDAASSASCDLWANENSGLGEDEEDDEELEGEENERGCEGSLEDEEEGAGEGGERKRGAPERDVRLRAGTSVDILKTSVQGVLRRVGQVQTLLRGIQG